MHGAGFKAGIEGDSLFGQTGFPPSCFASSHSDTSCNYYNQSPFRIEQIGKMKHSLSYTMKLKTPVRADKRAHIKKNILYSNLFNITSRKFNQKSSIAFSSELLWLCQNAPQINSILLILFRLLLPLVFFLQSIFTGFVPVPILHLLLTFPFSSVSSPFASSCRSPCAAPSPPRGISCCSSAPEIVALQWMDKEL